MKFRLLYRFKTFFALQISNMTDNYTDLANSCDFDYDSFSGFSLPDNPEQTPVIKQNCVNTQIPVPVSEVKDDLVSEVKSALDLEKKNRLAMKVQIQRALGVKRKTRKTRKNEGKYACDNIGCSYKTDKPACLTSHKLLHGPPKYKCEVCSRMFHQPTMLCYHRKTAHPVPNEKSGHRGRPKKSSATGLL
jgi:hypothetical protein